MALFFLLIITKKQPINSWKSHAGIVNSLLSVGNEVWSCSQDKKISIWDQKTGLLVKSLEAHDGRINCMSLVRIDDKQHVWTGSFDKTIIIWDVATQQQVRVVRGHEDDICCLLAVGNGTVYSGSRDQRVNLWQYATHEVMEKVQQQTEEYKTQAAIEKKFTVFKNGLMIIIDENLDKLKDMGVEIENTVDFAALVPIAKKIKIIKEVLEKP